MSANIGHIRTALLTMRVNRWRSLLTLFGVVVGVSGVIVVVGISQGVKRSITNQINIYSKNVITVTSKTTTGSNFGLATNLDASTLTSKDVTAIAKDKGVSASVPLAILSGKVSGYRPYPSAVVIATTANLPKVLNQSLSYGTFFSPEDGSTPTAVLGSSASVGLYKQTIPLGYTLNWRNEQLVVDGVMNAFKATPFSNNTFFNQAVFIPESAATMINQGTGSIFEILVKADSANQLTKVASEVNNTLLATHGGQHDFSVLLPSQVAANNTDFLNLLTELTIGIAIIALFVGGVGIMNVMLVSVTERMHEIGIRKAIGASNAQILNQFLVEAVTVSAIGGVIGIVLALIVDTVISLTTELTPEISWQVVLASAGVSIVLGVIFGIVPAFRASRKQPIAALRNE